MDAARDGRVECMTVWGKRVALMFAWMRRAGRQSAQSRCIYAVLARWHQTLDESHAAGFWSMENKDEMRARWTEFLAKSTTYQAESRNWRDGGLWIMGLGLPEGGYDGYDMDMDMDEAMVMELLRRKHLGRPEGLGRTLAGRGPTSSLCGELDAR